MRSLTIELSDSEQVALERAACENGVTLEDYARSLVTSTAARLSHHGLTQKPGADGGNGRATTASQAPVWERFAQRAARVPEGIRHPPADLGMQVSHYLYGTPKQD